MALAKLGRTDDAWRIARMLNPLRHSANQDAASRYRLEPYVMAADVYAAAAHVGRGGWSWYTGSAGWMYRLLTESLLGLKRAGNRLSFAPCVPGDWSAWSADWRHGAACYHIEFVRQPGAAGVTRVSVDGATQPANAIELVDDGREHDVVVHLDAPRPMATGATRAQAAPVHDPGAAH
jgi:cellobiose phosphorylase